MINDSMQIQIPAKNLIHYQKCGEISTRMCMVHSVDFSGSVLSIDSDKWVWVSENGIAYSEPQDEPGAFYPIYTFWIKNQHFYVKAWEYYHSCLDIQKKFDPGSLIDKVEEWYDWVLCQTEEFAIANSDQFQYEPIV